MLLVKIVYESIRMAMSQLISNKMRTFLSLLGITIGIFCIISVLSAVDSLEKSIMEGFSELGNDVVYVDRQPWTEDPGRNYWKYLKRPEPGLRDYDAIRKKSKLAQGAAYCFFTGGKTAKYKSSSLEGAFIMGTTFEYQDLQGIEIEYGRYFTPLEYRSAKNLVVIGSEVKSILFDQEEALGKEIKLLGQKFVVVGVLKPEGDDPFNMINFDEVIWMSLPTAQKYYNLSDYTRGFSYQKLLMAKAKEGVTLDELKDELTGIIRSTRKLRPSEDENFALNEVTMFEQVLEPVFSALNIAGFAIGIFALIVGMISVANIMFVSVKERTGLIGVKKALGAKRYFILLEFLIEAIFLCLLGGAIGLLMVFLLMKGISQVIPFDMWLSFQNMVLGVSVSVTVGILSGLIPASQASRLDPVVAMRQ